MCVALITGPRKTNWNKKFYSSFIVLFSAGESGVGGGGRERRRS